jgi:hypothetical protein
MKERLKYLQPIITGLLSLINLMNQVYRMNYLSILNSLIGVIAVLVFFKSHKQSNFISNIWLLLQIVILEIYEIETVVPIIDLSQVFSLKIGFSIEVSSELFYVSINLIPIVMLFVFKFTNQLNKNAED